MESIDTAVSSSSNERTEFEASASVAEKSRLTTANHPMATTATVTEVEQVLCECCGHVEECTPSYITHVRDLYCGKWVCGLCAEAVKEERGRGGGSELLDVDMENALKAHMSICMQFNKPGMTPGSPVTDLAAALKRMLRRSMDGSPSSRSAPSSPRRSSQVSRTYSHHSAFSRGFESRQ